MSARKKTERAPSTVVERLKASLESAADHNPNDAEQPAAVLWTDPDGQWLPIIPALSRLMPQLLVLGEYASGNRTGPSIWLRCVVDGALQVPDIPTQTPPVLYLPHVARQQLDLAEECPATLRPLIELQYRGACWMQRNGRDWTVEAYLVAKDGGLGLSVARDGATRQSMLRALGELATVSVGVLAGSRLDAATFDRLFSDDPVRDMLLWLDDASGVRQRWGADRWNAFRSRCGADFELDPEQDGPIVAAERLGGRDGRWASAWARFAESPGLYPGIPDLLRNAMPADLFSEGSSWPQHNEGEERALREALRDIGALAAPAARERIQTLEATHATRRDWVWARLGQAPLAMALRHLAELSIRATSELGGVDLADMANLYVELGWRVDAAALASMASVKSSADTRAVCGVLDAIYRPWLESAANHLQALVEKEPLPDQSESGAEVTMPPEGTVVLFSDGLRFDVAQRLAERERAAGRRPTISSRWTGLPTVTATAKPAVSPVASDIIGLAVGDDFQPVTANGARPLTASRFRKLLAERGYQVLTPTDIGDPSGRAWTESGDIDALGHSEQAKLAARLDDEVELLGERIEGLLDAGWREVRVVTDHGWLWLPGGLPKVELPKFLTQTRWARCAAIQGESEVNVPTMPWYWKPAERVAIGPGITCFGAGNAYAHGGLSLQESLVPIVSVTGGDIPDAEISIEGVVWVGLRCRIRVAPPTSAVTVTLRTRIGDPGSGLAKPRPLDEEGEASLLVTDDDLEGESVAVVVLSASGDVVARRATIVGGRE